MESEQEPEQPEGKKARRQAEIIRYLKVHHYISLDEITVMFDVTAQTARRDIMALEEAGKVRRLHGGATIATPIAPQVYRQRRVENAAQKQRIAAVVADLVPDGAALFLDTGTTCEAIAHALSRRRDLRIVTYSLRVATILSENTNFAVAVPGGFVRQVDGGVFREDTPEYIRKFKFHYAIISVSSLDEDGDICDDDHGEVAAVSAAIRQAERTILAVDSSKFCKRALVRLGTVDDIDLLVVDELPGQALLAKLRERDVEIHKA